MTENTREKRQRRGLIGDRNKLTVAGLTDTDEYQYRWVNDKEGRIQALWDEGYDLVDSKGKTVGDGDFESASKIGTALSKGVGQGVTAYLMKIPKDTLNANRRVKVDTPTDEQEQSIFEDVTGKDGTYGKVHIQK